MDSYKNLYEQLLEDFNQALYFAGKNNNVCNFCKHDCGEGIACQGRVDRTKCSPEWRRLVSTPSGIGGEE